MKNVNLTDLANKAIFSRNALNKLFDTIYPIVWHYYRIRLNDIEDAKDITQNACIKLVNNLEKFKSEKANFSTWMYKIIQNLLIDFFRKKSLPYEDLDINLLECTDSPLNRILEKEKQEEIKNSFKNLSPREKEILEMRYFFNMKNKEIAIALNIKEKTVSSLIVRAGEKIEKLLDKNGT